MFRINVHQTEPGKYRLKHKATGFQKMAGVTGAASLACDARELHLEISYNLYLAAKMLMRDLLYAKYGDSWKDIEHKHWKKIEKSIVRAIKFAH